MHQFPEYIVGNKEFFEQLRKIKSENKKQKYLQSASRYQLLGIVEICLNILKGNVPLSGRERKKLSKNAHFYRAVARSRSEPTARRRIQTGGSVTALAAILAPILGAIGQQILDKTLTK